MVAFLAHLPAFLIFFSWLSHPLTCHIAQRPLNPPPPVTDTQCRFADLQRLRTLWDQRKREVADREAGRASKAKPPFHLIGSCHISVPVNT